MIIESYSFLKKIIGRNAYNEIEYYARKIIPIATIVIGIIIGLSFIVHWGFLSSILSFVTGFSLVFVLYILGVIILFDRGIDVPLEQNIFSHTYSFPSTPPKGFNKTKIYGIILVVIGLAAVIITNIYRKNYAFDCETFLVDHENKEYHLNFDNGCEIASKASSLDEIQGYEIDNDYTLCEWCQDWADDAEDEYNSNRYRRR